jgi:formyltetrahydrofolate deformylase
VYRHGGNILHSDQHADQESCTFYQRVEWEMEGFRLSGDEIRPAFAEIAARFGMQWRLHFSDERPRMAVLVSREGHCLYDLLARHRMGEIQAEVPLIVSNHDELRTVADLFGVPYQHCPIANGEKDAQEAQVLALFQRERIDLVVLAKYMQVLTPRFVAAYPSAIVNIHHSFLPAFIGSRPYHQAHERGVKLIGATGHFVTDDLDQGPIIAQAVTEVSHRDSVKDMIAKGRELEKTVLARALTLHLAHRVLAHGRKTVVFD